MRRIQRAGELIGIPNQPLSRASVVRYLIDAGLDALEQCFPMIGPIESEPEEA